MMNISTIVNSVKCTFFACFVHFLHVLEGSTVALRMCQPVVNFRYKLFSILKHYIYLSHTQMNPAKLTHSKFIENLKTGLICVFNR